MLEAPLPANEEARLAALRRYNILDTFSEEAFDDLVRLAAHICNTPIAMVSMSDADRQWFKARIGIDVDQVPRNIAFCQYALLKPEEMLLVPDTLKDDRFATNPLVTGEPHVRFYAGTPLLSQDGYVLGTLCVLDKVPHMLRPDQLEALKSLGHQVLDQLELRRRVAELEQTIDERKQLEDHLMRYHSAFESTSDAIGMADLKGRATHLNHAFSELYGYTVDDLSQPGSSALPFVDSELAVEVFNILRSGQPWTGEVDLFAKSGRVIPTMMRANCIIDDTGHQVGIVGVFTDITERKRAEALIQQAQEQLERRVTERTFELSEANALLHLEITERKQIEQALLKSQATMYALLDAIPDIMLRVRHDGTFLNFRAARAFASSLSPVTPLPEKIADIKPSRLAVQMIEAIEKTLQTGVLQTFAYPIEIDGEIQTREARVVTSGDDEVLIIVRDITVQKQVEEALVAERSMLSQRVEERTAALSAANAELARSARLKDEFLASMSHELRTPLNAVLGLSEALQEEVYGPLTERQAKALRNIEESGRHLLSLINDILELSKIEAGKLELNVGPVAIESVCQSSVRLVKQAAHKKRLTVSTSFDSTVNVVQADERHLKQMLVNLLSNAVKFTPEGGSIGLEVAGDAAHEVVRCTVWDTGIGIPNDDMARLFQPFVQLDSSLSRQYAGTGLGLALVYRMAELHGGSISVESTVGAGSRFTIALPWKESTAGELLLNPTQPHPDSAPPISMRRALIVEDSRLAAEQTARYLNELDVVSCIHPQGEGTVEQALATHPDVILLDIQLPQQSGWDVLAQLKADERTRAIPVLIISVVDEPERAQALGASGYLVKPIGRQLLHAALHTLALPALVNASSTQATPTPEPALILLAEDNEDNVTTLVDYLHAKNYQVAVARNGNEAITRAREIHPDIILMDIQMPVMDGLTAMRHIRVDAELAEIPIIALTALAMPGDRERCLKAGANDYMSKPVSLQGLVKAIETQRQCRQAAQEIVR